MGYENKLSGRQPLDLSTLRGWRYAAFLLFELSQQRNVAKIVELVPKVKDVDHGKSDPRPEKQLLRGTTSVDSTDTENESKG
jgi:mannose/fructose/N-acetylgalactosamine-specific phosphotransferase system component IIB